MPEKIVREAKAVVETSIFGGEDEEVISLGVKKFLVDPAHITLAIARTINMGNYESAKITVSLTVPVYREALSEKYYKQTAEAVYEKAAKILSEKVDMINKVKNSKGL